MSNRVFLFNRFARSSAAATWLKLREGARRMAGTLVGITLVRRSRLVACLKCNALRLKRTPRRRGAREGGSAAMMAAPLGDEARGRGEALR